MALRHLLDLKLHTALKEKSKIQEINADGIVEAEPSEGLNKVVIKEATKTYELEEGEDFSSLPLKAVFNLLILSPTKREQESNKGGLIASF